jgi:hypothetical protein
MKKFQESKQRDLPRGDAAGHLEAADFVCKEAGFWIQLTA